MDLRRTLSLVVMFARLLKTQFHLYEKLQLSLVKLLNEGGSIKPDRRTQSSDLTDSLTGASAPPGSAAGSTTLNDHLRGWTITSHGPKHHGNLSASAAGVICFTNHVHPLRTLNRVNITWETILVIFSFFK
eukprot:COSAG01_NODE_5133_length_4460_cov_4.745359_1_plen_131_part_00